jgi:hypothetical protein
MPSLTNLTFPAEEEDLLREAIKHYRFENLNQFFRVCGHAIIDHYKRGETLLSPLRFEAWHSSQSVYRPRTNPELLKK